MVSVLVVAQIKFVVYKSDGSKIMLLANEVDSIGFEGTNIEPDDTDKPVYPDDEELQIPEVEKPGRGYTTIVLYIPESECEDAEPFILGVLDGTDKWYNDYDRVMEPLGNGWWKVTVDALTPKNTTNFKFRMDDGEDGWMYQPKNSYELLEDADDYLQIKADETNNLVAIDYCSNKVLYIKSGKWSNTPCRAPIPAGHAKFIFTPTGDVPEGKDLIFTGNFGADNNEWYNSDRIMTKQADGTYVWEGDYPVNFRFKVIVKDAAGIGNAGNDGVLWLDGDDKVVEAESGSVIKFEGCFYGLCPGDEVDDDDTEVVISTPSGYHNSYGYVDLGLPSGTLWATMNVGADSPEDYGDYFAWGETTTKSTYEWGNYKWCNGSEYSLTKYCTDSYYGIVDNKTELELVDDAAYINWGGDWRMPTYEEQKELQDNCTCVIVFINEVSGLLVTGKNGNSIFLPLAGYIVGSELLDAGSYANYWSSSLSSTRFAKDWHFSSGSGVWHSSPRENARTIRPILSR